MIPLPGHAYVPGRNERHAEDAFETVRSTARPGLSAPALAGCDAFVAGLQFLEAGYFWEAHEVLEPVWLALPEPSVERRLVQGLIQLANGRLKLAMNRPKAAQRLVAITRGLVPSPDDHPVVMTLQTRDVHDRIDALERDAARHG